MVIAGRHEEIELIRTLSGDERAEEEGGDREREEEMSRRYIENDSAYVPIANLSALGHNNFATALHSRRSRVSMSLLLNHFPLPSCRWLSRVCFSWDSLSSKISEPLHPNANSAGRD